MYENGGQDGKVAFSQLLPPGSCSKRVAARGFMNVLRLVATGHARVQQTVPLGAITIHLSLHPAVSPVFVRASLQLARK